MTKQVNLKLTKQLISQLPPENLAENQPQDGATSALTIVPSDRFVPTDMTVALMSSMIPRAERTARILDRIGHHFGNDPVTANTLAAIAEETETHWGRAHLEFYEVGNRLLAFEELTSGEALDDALDDGGIIAIDPTKLSMLKTIARQLRAKKFDLSEVPPYYTTVYQIAKMPPHQLAEARAKNLIRPDVTNAEIKEWIKSGKTKEKIVGSDNTVAGVEASLKKLIRRGQSLKRQLIEIEIAIEERSKALVRMKAGLGPEENPDEP